MLNEGRRGGRQVFIGDSDRLRPHPVWAGYPLGSEGLNVLDGVLGGVGEKFAEDTDSFIVGDMDVGFIMQRFPMYVLGGLLLVELVGAIVVACITLT